MPEKKMNLDEVYKSVEKRMKEDEEFQKELFEKFKNEMDLGKLSASREKEDVDAKKGMAVYAKALYEDSTPSEVVEKTGTRVRKDALETDFSNAGFAIPTPLRDEIVPILDSEPAYLDAGPQIVDMPQGKLDVGRQNQDPTSQWQDEGATVSESDVAGDLLQLSPHKLTSRVDLSNDFLRREEKILGEDYIMDRMMKSASNKLDSTLLEGNGTQFQPTGLLELAASSNVFASSGTSISDIVGDLKTARNNLDGADVPEDNRAWFMHPQVRNDLVFDINANEDTFPFREELREDGTLFGDPVYTTTNIDLDGSDNSNIYYAELSECMVGRATEMELASSPHEQFSSDVTILKLISHWDQILMHEEAVSVITDYTLQ